MFRRAKLLLDAVPVEVLDASVGTGLLVGRLGLTDVRGDRCVHEWCRHTSPGPQNPPTPMTECTVV